MSFTALYLTKTDGAFEARLRDDLTDDELHARTGDASVVVRLAHSTINYKDGLALTNRSPVVRQWPMVPGIDGAGTVELSTDPRWSVGDQVIHNGWGVGETHWGCLSQKARLKGEWLIALPAELSTGDAMAIGTAGYTAMLCVMALEDAGVRPDSGEILVTGASGGVGSVAVALLSGLGYRVVASTGKLDEAEYLRALGAVDILDRAGLSTAGKPLQKERWAGVVDSVGSHTLANALAQTRYGGAVAACGLAQGMELSTSVAPFILRGVRLLGVDSVMCPIARRQQAWTRLATDLDRGKLASMTRTIGLAEASQAAVDILAGKIRGRVVVDVNA
jgi:acrylyl-CoA reductase (NADPH)